MGPSTQRGHLSFKNGNDRRPRRDALCSRPAAEVAAVTSGKEPFGFEARACDPPIARPRGLTKIIENGTRGAMITGQNGARYCTTGVVAVISTSPVSVPDNKALPGALWICAGLVLIAAVFPLPHGYYTFARVVTVSRAPSWRVRHIAARR